MKLIPATSENIIKAAKYLQQGNIVAFPTETVYGLGADGLNPIAVTRIFEAKKRPAFNPLILHVSSMEMVKRVAHIDNEIVTRLTDKFWPGALTIILRKKDIVPYIVTSGLDTVAVRMPNNQVALKLIEELGNPIAAPSANSFGRLSPTNASHVAKQLESKVDIILDGGNCTIGIESTIIEITDSVNYLLRPGGIAREDIETLIGKLSDPTEKLSTPNSPGQLKVHYAPKIPIKFYSEETLLENKNKKLGGIFFSKVKNKEMFIITRTLSDTEDFREAASNLFSYLHELENVVLDLILVESLPKVNLGAAIMDRLTKAVNKYQYLK